jgi:hypothetical protein
MHIQCGLGYKAAIQIESRLPVQVHVKGAWTGACSLTASVSLASMLARQDFGSWTSMPVPSSSTAEPAEAKPKKKRPKASACACWLRAFTNDG